MFYVMWRHWTWSLKKLLLIPKHSYATDLWRPSDILLRVYTWLWRMIGTMKRQEVYDDYETWKKPRQKKPSSKTKRMGRIWFLRLGNCAYGLGMESAMRNHGNRWESRILAVLVIWMAIRNNIFLKLSYQKCRHEDTFPIVTNVH